MGAIYSILNLVDGKIYVGQSVNPSKRRTDHFRELRKNIHHNIHLQRAWNKYGEDAFVFNILENCADDKLNDNEVWWIEYFDSTNHDKGYNLETGGDSNYIVNEETRAKFIGENNPMYGRRGELAPNYGKSLSDETKKKLRESHLGSSIIDEWGGLWFLETFASLGVTKSYIGRCIGLSGDAIDSYLKCRGKSWKEITPNHIPIHVPRKKRLIELGGLDFIKENIRNGKTQKEIVNEYDLGNKRVVRDFLKGFGYSWKSLVDEVMSNG